MNGPASLPFYIQSVIEDMCEYSQINGSGCLIVPNRRGIYKNSYLIFQKQRADILLPALCFNMSQLNLSALGFHRV